MRLLAFSDLHLSRAHAAALVAASADADLVIGAGDFCNVRRGLRDAMEMLAGLAAPLIAVPGNAESDDELRAAAPDGTTVLHAAATEAEGVQVFGIGGGIPRTPFGAWSWDFDEDEARALLEGCTQADVLVSHSPPRGAVDVTSRGQSVGSVALREAVERLQPALVLCGHIHDCWGQEAMIGASRVVNLGPRPAFFDL